MRTARLPMPGLLWGAYPEQRKRPRTGIVRVPPSVRVLFDGIGTWQTRRDRKFVGEVRAHESSLRELQDGRVASALRTLRLALQRDGLTDGHVARAFAFISRACARTLGMEVFDTQLIAARIVLDNRLAEMATGEGKTLAVALAAGAAGLAGIPVHVITANDYLVARDAAMLGPLYAALGLSVGAVTEALAPPLRRAAYASGITYCTAKELVFDYLRDGLGRTRDPQRWRVEQLADADREPPLLRGLCLAIVDEADTVLIDEARVPLILSSAAGAGDERQYLDHALRAARELREGEHFRLDAAALSATITASGRGRLEQACAALGPVWRNRLHREETVATAVSALHLYQRDRHYLVRDGKIHIIDETTGRIAAGRAWSRGLHQLIELKEGCAPTLPLVTAAQITYQRFFPRYLRLGGLSGTLHESRGELLAVYGLNVRRVPLRRPNRRTVLASRLHANRNALWDAVTARVASLRQAGRPVLVGTESVADSESLSRRLTEAGLPHAVLNARHDQDEARIVARAGSRGSIIIATNMAGRGTDFPLAPGVAELGGLHIICCQLNAARRIDRQLWGRCARQGDPGSVETWLSTETLLLRRVMPRWWQRALGARGAAIPSLVVRTLAGAVQRVEERRHFLQRKRLFEHDGEMDRRLSFGGPAE